MYWKIVAKSEKWIPFKGLVGRVRIEDYERDKRFRYQGALLTCYVETDDELEAEEIAEAAFDQVVRSLIMASCISYHVAMATPVQVDKSEVDNGALVTNTSVPTILKSYLVRPFVGYALPLFSISEANRWQDLISKLEEPWTRRVVDLYCLGIRLKDISETAAYIEFIKIVELFIDHVYRKMIEREAPQSVQEPNQETKLRATLRKLLSEYFPGVGGTTIDEVSGGMIHRLSLPYSNRELLRYVCTKSGFYAHILDRRRDWLKRNTDEIYGYWPEDKRKQHVEEIYKEHEQFVNTASLDLFSVRAKVAHATPDSGASFVTGQQLGAYSICAMLSRYLIDMLVQGRIQIR